MRICPQEIEISSFESLFRSYHSKLCAFATPESAVTIVMASVVRIIAACA